MNARTVSRSSAATAAFLLLLTACGPDGEPAAAPSPEDEVLDAVQALFDVLAERDTAALRDLMLPRARLLALRPGEGNDPVLDWMTVDEFAGALTEGEGELLERMWDPEVRVDGPIAAVWTPYDFHVDGALSHCGVNGFHFVRREGAWRMASVIYTVVPAGECDPAPLPPVDPEAGAG